MPRTVLSRVGVAATVRARWLRCPSTVDRLLLLAHAVACVVQTQGGVVLTTAVEASKFRNAAFTVMRGR